MQTRTIEVRATWDGEAKVWVAESDDVPGLVTESPTLEALIAKLHILIPELIEENLGATAPDIPFEIVWRTQQIAHVAD